MTNEERKAKFHEEFSDDYLTMLEGKGDKLPDLLREIMWMCYARGLISGEKELDAVTKKLNECEWMYEGLCK